MKVIDNVRLYKPFSEHEDGLYHAVIDNGKFREIKKGLYDRTDNTEVINGGGNTLAPSFNDSHLHLLRFGLMDKELDFRDITSWEEMKKMVKDKYNHGKMEENEWIVGRGLDDSQLEDLDYMLDSRDLEELDYQKPVFFLHEDGHECIVNEEAMKIIKEKDDLSGFPPEFIETDEEGNWTGRFKDTVVHFIKFHFRQKSKIEVKEAVEDGVQDLLKHGITSVHTDDLNYVGSYQTLWNAYTELEEEGKLPIDVHLHHYIFSIEDVKKFIEESTMRTGDGTHRVKVGAIKIFLDGTQRLHTSALRKPYTDAPEKNGILNYSQSELNDILQLADENDLQVTMHAIGDRAVEAALHAIEQVGEAHMRHRIIHAQVLGPDLLERMAEIKPYLEIQPGFMMSEYKETAKWVGEDRVNYCNIWNTVNQKAIPYTCSSDCPIGPLSPMIEMFAAVNRTDKEGNPSGGWMSEEKVSIDTIYNAYTEIPAQLEFREEVKGKVQEGFLADFILLSDHPKEINAFDIKDLEVVETWSQGEKVFAK